MLPAQAGLALALLGPDQAMVGVVWDYQRQTFFFGENLGWKISGKIRKLRCGLVQSHLYFSWIFYWVLLYKIIHGDHGINMIFNKLFISNKFWENRLLTWIWSLLACSLISTLQDPFLFMLYLRRKERRGGRVRSWFFFFWGRKEVV